MISTLPPPTTREPRTYQTGALDRCRELIAGGKRAPILLAPTGSGKTFIASMMLASCVEKGKYGVFLARGRELIFQASDDLDREGVPNGVIIAGQPRTSDAPVQVCSKDTLAVLSLRGATSPLPPADLLIVDECHLSIADEWRELIGKFKAANHGLIVVGLTATAARGDGLALSNVFDCIVNVASYAELRKLGFIVPARVFNPSTPDLRKIARVDWETKGTDKLDRPKIIGDVVEHWKAFGDGRRTVVFTSRIAHAKHLAEAFCDEGVKAASIDQSTVGEDRDAILKAFAQGDLELITNCDVLTYGWDCPPCSCVILAAPTRSLVKYRQRCGRTLRPYPGKVDCLVFDHGGASLIFGYPDEDIEWSLDGENVDERQTSAVSMRKDRVCSKCGHQFVGAAKCPNCGAGVSKSARRLATSKGLLREARRDEPKRPVLDDQEAWTKLYFVGKANGWTFKKTRMMFKLNQGYWPPDTLSYMPRTDVDNDRKVRNVSAKELNFVDG